MTIIYAEKLDTGFFVASDTLITPICGEKVFHGCKVINLGSMLVGFAGVTENVASKPLNLHSQYMLDAISNIFSRYGYLELVRFMEDQTQTDFIYVLTGKSPICKLIKGNSSTRTWQKVDDIAFIGNLEKGAEFKKVSMMCKSKTVFGHIPIQKRLASEFQSYLNEQISESGIGGFSICYYIRDSRPKLVSFMQAECPLSYMNHLNSKGFKLTIPNSTGIHEVICSPYVYKGREIPSFTIPATNKKLIWGIDSYSQIVEIPQ